MEYTDNNPLKLIELFAGIGSQTQALKNIGIPHEVVAISEIDKYAIQSYEAIHGKVNNMGDIRAIKELPSADMWTYSFPCFKGDTLILAEEGIKRIADIVTGDKVLTHNNRYKEVLATMNQGTKKIIKLSAMGIDEIKWTLITGFMSGQSIENMSIIRIEIIGCLITLYGKKPKT